MTNGIAISARGVRKSYGARVPFTNFSLDVAPGAVVGLSGANGSGKSTLIGMIAGVARPSSGRIEVDGVAPGSARLRGHVGVLMEGGPPPSAAPVGPFLLCLARLQGLAHPARAVDEALTLVGDPSWKKARFRELSYGMRRRVGLAQALMGSPRLVLLDEPTDGLDVDAARNVRRLVEERRGQCTFVIASHDADVLAKVCTHTVSLGGARGPS